MLRRGEALSAAGRCGRGGRQDDRRGGDRDGYAGLFLCHERTDEDADRPLLRSLYRNEKQGVYFIATPLKTITASWIALWPTLWDSSTVWRTRP